ncbi:MAG TPA: hypothetical protein VK611_08490 [Acidimicrobiales bacterium]|nr:hypothetical protein [Acidimicrobiales bacterium]
MGNIKVGVAVADMSAFEAVDPAYGIGDQAAQVAAALEGTRARGVAHAADVELVFRTFDAVDPDQKRAVARAFAADGVAAVLGARDFTYGAVALAERLGVPVLDVNAVPTPVHARCAPLLFTIRTAQDVLYRAFIRWAAARGAFDGSPRIGVFSDRYTETSTNAALAELERLGHHDVVRVRSDGLGYGSDDDVDAATRFRDEGVTVLLPFVSGSSLVELLGTSSALGHRPTVVDLETGEHATDVTASLMPPAIYDGTVALALNRVGESAAGRALTPRTEQALADHEAATGRRLDTSGRASSGELSNVLLTSDLVDLLLAALGHVDGATAADAVVAGFEAITDRPSASGGDITFAPGEHWGYRHGRTITWSAAAEAWQAQDEYRPLSRSG